jgi:hypothetical protein
LNDSQRNFRNNAEHFDWELRKLSPESRVKLAKFLIQRTYLVAVSTPNLDSAYRIFSILNERGLDLSHADILKSEIIGQIPGDRQDEYATKWEKAEEDLGRDEFVDIFAHIRMIYGKVKLRETVLKEFRSSVISRFPDQMELIDKVILPFADAYREVKTRSYESARGAEPINELLGWLNRIDNFDWIPPAIVGMSKWGKHPDRLRRFLMDLERLAASMMIRRADVNHRIERYGRVLVSIEEGEDLSSSASPLQLSSDECRETLKVLGGDIYPIVKIRLYVLLRLDAALSGGGATYDYPLITVEHVLPQNPETGSEWERWFPEAESREMYTHRLGNLVLLTRMKNSQASNYPFERKKNEYFSRKGVSPFALTTQVLTKKVWTPEVIDRRQQELLGNLKGLWRL